jgi:hypothetical protein
VLVGFVRGHPPRRRRRPRRARPGPEAVHRVSLCAGRWRCGCRCRSVPRPSVSRFSSPCASRLKLADSIISNRISKSPDVHPVDESCKVPALGLGRPPCLCSQLQREIAHVRSYLRPSRTCPWPRTCAAACPEPCKALAHGARRQSDELRLGLEARCSAARGSPPPLRLRPPFPARTLPFERRAPRAAAARPTGAPEGADEARGGSVRGRCFPIGTKDSGSLSLSSYL